MALRHIGTDPESEGGSSPTAWWDDETHEVVLQGWLPGPEMLTQAHATGAIPPGEGVVRLPARMIPMIREACDAAEGA